MEKARLVERAQTLRLGNLTFLDPIPKNAIPALFSRCQVGLLTLKDIPLFRSGVSPNKLFDYMGGRLPVLTNVEGECGEIVRSARCGWVVRPGDPVALAEALSAAVEAPNRPELGENGHRYIAAHFDRELFVGALGRVLATDL